MDILVGDANMSWYGVVVFYFHKSASCSMGGSFPFISLFRHNSVIFLDLIGALIISRLALEEGQMYSLFFSFLYSRALTSTRVDGW